MARAVWMSCTLTAAVVALSLVACGSEDTGSASTAGGPGGDPGGDPQGGNCSAGLDECPAIDECHDSDGYVSCGDGCATQYDICGDSCLTNGNACHYACPDQDLSSPCHTQCNLDFNTCLLEVCEGKWRACICPCFASFGCCDTACSCH